MGPHAHPGGMRIVRSSLAARILPALLLAALLLVPGPLGRAQDSRVESLAGEFLVATQQLDGSRFAESVILLIEHNAEGAFGLRINRPLGTVTWADLLDRLNLEGEAADGEVTLFSGGPVQRRNFFLLHGTDADMSDSKRVLNGVAITGRGDMVRRLARGEGPKRVRAILGYAGWAAGQLERELRRGDWFTTPAEADLVFSETPGEVWDKARRNRTIEL